MNSTPAWRLIPAKGELPGPRSGAASVVVGDKLYLFGGYGLSYLVDMTVQVGEYSLLLFTVPNFNINNKVTNHLHRLADLHSFNFTTRTWKEIDAKGKGPSIRSCPSWVQRKTSIYIFGGYDGVQRMNDFFEFNVQTSTWTQLMCTGAIPSPRYFHSSIVYSDKMYSFGGYNGVTRLNDMHRFDFETCVWTKIEVDNGEDDLRTLGELPSGRSSIVAQVYENTLLVFGGYDGRVVLNDFYEYRFASLVVPPPSLVEDLRSLVNNRELSDTTFIVEGKEVYASRVHLAARSEHFRAMLFGGLHEASTYSVRSPSSNLKARGAGAGAGSGDSATTSSLVLDSGKSGFIVSGITYNVFLKILEFLYTDQIQTIEPEIAVELLIASERFLLARLKGLCEDSIRKRIMVENVISIFMAAHQHRALGLKEICLDFILSNLDEVKATKSFSDLKAEPELLMEIIMRGDL
eukprot:g1790.t1